MRFQSRGGYLRSAGSDHEGCHVEYYDADTHRDVHLLFTNEREADQFLRREFPEQENSGVTYTGYGANTHAPSGN